MTVFSVIVPVYNDAPNLPNCLDSLLRQSFRDFEIIVVDDGSTDSTPSTIASYTKSHKKVRPIFSTHHGAPSALNLGIKNAKGKFLAFTDSDCTADKDWLKNFASALKKSQVVNGKILYAYSTPLGKAHAETYAIHCASTKSAGVSSVFETGNSAASREIFNRFGIFDEHAHRAYDHDFARRLKLVGIQIAYCPNAIVTHAEYSKLSDHFRRAYVMAFTDHYFATKHNEKPRRDLIEGSLFFYGTLLLLISQLLINTQFYLPISSASALVFLASFFMCFRQLARFLFHIVSFNRFLIFLAHDFGYKAGSFARHLGFSGPVSTK